MLRSNEIREVQFPTKAVGGYRQDEVDLFLDKVEADYEWYERNVAELQSRIARLNEEMETLRGTQESIQSVLLNAQRLADQIVAEAREKSAQIVAEAQVSVDQIAERERELSSAFEEKANQRKAVVNREIEATLRAAKLKNTAMEAAANDAVARQQLLYDKLRLEISAFKSDITRKYREHLELLQKLPDTVPMDPQQIAAAAAAAVDRVPAPESFVPAADLSAESEEQPTNDALLSETPAESAPEPEEQICQPISSEGFMIQDLLSESADETDE